MLSIPLPSEARRIYMDGDGYGDLVEDVPGVGVRIPVWFVLYT